jgi:hypothetical protein
MTKFKELDTVILTRDVKEKNLEKGDVGAVVVVYKNGTSYEVEFVEADGRTKALLTLMPNDINPYLNETPGFWTPMNISYSTVGTPVFLENTSLRIPDESSDVNFVIKSEKDKSTHRINTYKLLWA